MYSAEIGPLEQVRNFLESEEHYSVSALGTYLDCQRLFKYSREQLLAEGVPAVKRDFGSAMHDGLAGLLKTGELETAFDWYLRTYDKLINPQLDAVPPNYARADGLDLLGRYAMKWRHEPFRIRPEFVEVGIVARIEDFWFVARLDGIGEPIGQPPIPIEHKTTGKMSDWWIKSFTPNHQITAYIYLLRLATGGKSQLRAIVDGLEVAPTAERLAKNEGFIRMEVARTPADLENWRSHTIATVRKIRESRDRGEWLQNDTHCRNCAYRSICMFNEAPSILSHWPRKSPRLFI